MALTTTFVRRSVFGNRRVTVADVDFDSSYPTGGESLTATNLGMSVLDLVLVSNKGGLIFEYDYTNSKLLAKHPTGGAASTGLAAPTVAVPSGATAVTSTAAQPNLTETAGIAAEVGNTADLSTIEDVRVVAIGH